MGHFADVGSWSDDTEGWSVDGEGRSDDVESWSVDFQRVRVQDYHVMDHGSSFSADTGSWAGKLCYCGCSLIGLSILLESLADTGSWAGKLCYC